MPHRCIPPPYVNAILSDHHFNEEKQDDANLSLAAAVVEAACHHTSGNFKTGGSCYQLQQ